MQHKPISYEKGGPLTCAVVCPKDESHGYIHFVAVQVGEPAGDVRSHGLLTTVSPYVGMSTMVTKKEDDEQYYPSRRTHVKLTFSCEICHNPGSKLKDLYELFVINHKGTTNLFWNM